MANLLPTKGNLIAAKRSRTLARTGYELMDRKRNILIRELMGMIDTAKELQGQIDAVFTEAYTALQAANIRLGICDRIAEAVDVDDSLTLRYRSVMGVELPRIPGQSPPAPAGVRHGGTCSELDECYLKFYRVKELSPPAGGRWRPLSTAWPTPSKRPRSGPTLYRTLSFPAWTAPSVSSPTPWRRRSGRSLPV